MAKRSPEGKTVRRIDRNGNAYFLNRETGKRVTRDAWERDKARARVKERAPIKAPTKERTPTTSKRGPTKPTEPITGGDGPSRQPPSGPTTPFPPDVDDDGWPLDDQGQYDDDAFAIEGDDDT